MDPSSVEHGRPAGPPTPRRSGPAAEAESWKTTLTSAAARGPAALLEGEVDQVGLLLLAGVHQLAKKFTYT